MKRRAMLDAVQFFRFRNVTKAKERRIRKGIDEICEEDCVVLNASPDLVCRGDLSAHDGDNEISSLFIFEAS